MKSIGLGFWRFYMGLYARSIWKYKQIILIPTLTLEAVKGVDRYLDIEFRFLCFGVGMRFIWLSKRNKSNKLLILPLLLMIAFSYQSCSNESEILTRTINSIAMEEVTKILPYDTAGAIQRNAQSYECQITDVAVVGGGNARISVVGTRENIIALFDFVGVDIDAN